MNQIQENIFVGSLLDDGNLALYGRSKNAYYREHGHESQNGYRKWKASQLNMQFIEKHNKIRSNSLPMFTNYYKLFYPNRKKTITKENINLLNHPIGLMCLYFDDGSLVIDKYKRKNSIHIFPRIYLYTQSFSKEENMILCEHIKDTFKIEFNLKKVPNGTGYCLNMNKRDQINQFLNLIKPYAKEIPCMEYKVNVQMRYEAYVKNHPEENIVTDPIISTSKPYSLEEEEYHKLYPKWHHSKRNSSPLRQNLL